MGKTVPSHRKALEFEIQRWKGFRDALPNEEERVAFDELMDMCRNSASAGSCDTNPIIFEPMTMSILLTQQNKLRELEYKLNEALGKKICTQENNTNVLTNLEKAADIEKLLSTNKKTLKGTK